MAKASSRDTELVLENRHVVAVFLGIALLCGVFFALGYVVGRNTMSGVVTAAPADEEITHSAEKPSSMPAPTYIPSNQTTAPAATETGADAGTDLGFYQAVEQKQPDAKLEAPEAASAPPAPATDTAVQPPPEGILVQVSALSRREDAEGLVDLLKEKKLPVLVTSSTQDSLFHVVVGPYKTDKDADRVKSLLEQEGFRPFIRR